MTVGADGGGRRPGSRLRQSIAAFVSSPDSSLFDVIGGWRGLIDAVGPNLMFLVVYLAFPHLAVTVGSALAMSLVIAVIRIVRRQPLREAVAGVVLVVASGLLVALTGNGTDFFLPELIRTAAVSAVLVLSLLARRPLVGVLLGPVVRGRGWRKDATLLRAYDWCTALWAAAAMARTAVKLPFYLAGNVIGLGIADIIMGIPLLLATVYLQLRILRRAHSASADEEEHVT